MLYAADSYLKCKDCLQTKRAEWIDFEVIHSTFRPRSRMQTPAKRPTQEVGYIVSGKLDLTLGGREFTVGPGDSFRFRAEAYSWANPYDEPVVAIWVIAPPVY